MFSSSTMISALFIVIITPLILPRLARVQAIFLMTRIHAHTNSADRIPEMLRRQINEIKTL